MGKFYELLIIIYKSVRESRLLEDYLFNNCPEGKICGKFLKKKAKMCFIEGMS